MLKRVGLAVALVALLSTVWAPRAEASPITGGFSIIGNFLPVDSTGNVTSLASASGLDFITLFGSTATPGVNGNFLVTSANGSFNGLAGTSGSIRDFSFLGAGSAAFPNPNVAGPLLAFQSLATATFTLTSIGAPTVLSGGSSLLLSGQGYFSMNGYTNTYGTFTFTGNGANGTFSFSASNGSTGVTVPEPASAALLSGGLMLLAFGRRYRLNRA